MFITDHSLLRIWNIASRGINTNMQGKASIKIIVGVIW